MNSRSWLVWTLRTLRYVVLLGLWLLLTVLGMEAFLRLAIELRPIDYVFDKNWGWRPAAGSRVLWAREGFGVTYYSHDGELATPFDDGANVVVLGDSHTEAYQVNSDQNYVSVAEKILRQQGRPLNLRNLGRSNVALADYIYLAPFILKAYSPVMVVIQISEKDFEDLYAFNASRPNYFVMTNGRIEVMHTPPTYQDHWLGKVMNASTFITEGVERWRAIQWFGSPGQTVAAAPGRTGATPLATVPNQLEALRQAYADVPVVVVVLPYVPEIDKGSLVYVSHDYDALLGMVKSVRGWHVVDPLSEFQSMAQNGTLPRGFSNTLPGTGHLNSNGHAVVGHLLAAQIDAVLP